MTPYSGLLFFYALVLLLLPAVALGFLEKPLKAYGLVFSVLMLLLIFWLEGQLIQLITFYLYQCIVCFVYFRGKHSRPGLWLAVALALLPLAAVKLAAAFPLPGFLQLLGVSYMSFRAVGVLLDIHDGKLQALGLSDWSYFLLFFPAVSSGPLDRFRRFSGDLSRRLSRGEYLGYLRRGVFKLMFGALNGVVISGLIRELWLSPLPQSGFAATLGYMYGYTLYLFFNFAGISLMAVGTAYILGIALPDNFNMPFLSLDMKDFWSRWHISLSGWLRDYVYTRFVMRSLKQKRFKNKRSASYLGYIITMLAMGAWHGLTPAYLVYGAYHGLLMCLNEALDLNVQAFKKLKRRPAGRVLLVVITFHLFSFGLLIFSGRII